MKRISTLSFALFLACGSSNDAGQSKEKSEPGPGEEPADTRPKYPEYLEIDEIAIFQAVKVPLASREDGKMARVTDRKAPVVGGRPGLLRVYVLAKRGWKKHAVQCELTLVTKDGTVSTDKVAFSPFESSREDDLDTSCNFALTPKQIASGTGYSVRITDEQGLPVEEGEVSKAIYPSDGEAESFRAQAGNKLRVTLVPVAYNADQSGRTPDVSESQLGKYRDRMLALYPATDVEVTLHKPFAWDSAIAPSGQGWPEILEAIRALREEEKPADDVYYYGVFDPATSGSVFCGRGCVAGLSGLAESASEAFLRASVGLGFPGQEMTMAHEIGHAHGRSHAPCGNPGGPDPDYPHMGGSIGVWGYDIMRKSLKSPTEGKDVMGYCTPEWVSDYTYNAFFKRITDVATMANARISTEPTASKVKYRVAMVNERGVAKLGGLVDFKLPPSATTRALSYVGADGRTAQRGVAHYYPFDHLAGGFYVFPDSPENQSAYEAIDISGVARIRR